MEKKKKIKSPDSMLELGEEINRVEVVDDNGRVYSNWKVSNLKLSLQDDNRTLKIFIKGKVND